MPASRSHPLVPTAVRTYIGRRLAIAGIRLAWGLLPVTDGYFVQQLPSQQLLQKKVNGQRLLVGNNASEGPGFTPQNITTEDDLLACLHLTFPMFSNDDIVKILLYYLCLLQLLDD